MRFPWQKKTEPEATDARTPVRDAAGTVLALAWIDDDGDVLIESIGSGVAVCLTDDGRVHLGAMDDSDFVSLTTASPWFKGDETRTAH